MLHREIKEELMNISYAELYPYISVFDGETNKDFEFYFNQKLKTVDIECDVKINVSYTRENEYSPCVNSVELSNLHLWSNDGNDTDIFLTSAQKDLIEQEFENDLKRTYYGY